ncbi:MAG TPA: sodium/proton-translocating pyrophosphatase, partial [Paracoccaceae bacterium]|nr:sodium/proton-translocating pyrophosphatase [Paracoccaceae bacterium]
MDSSITILPPLFGIAGLITAFVLYSMVMRYPAGEPNIRRIGEQMHLGAMVFMRREYSYLAAFVAVLVFFTWVFLGSHIAIAVIIGALSSSIAGWIGMYAATKANVRTATAAQMEGAASALTVAFFGGSIMGLSVAALGLIGLGGLFWYLGGEAHSLEGFGMGASSVALFSRVGGGIFTKSADIGADLVGKIEAGIPEDDPRNPGVIADNVGDNVGDVAGMGSDIFESYCGAMIATIAIAATLVGTVGADVAAVMMFLPLGLATIGLIASAIMIYVVKTRSAIEPAKALRTATIGAPIIFLMAALILIWALGLPLTIWLAVISGAVGGVAIGLVTEYYTAST